MSRKTEKVAPDVVEAIDTVIRARMARWGYTHAEVRPGLDHGGDPVIFVDAHYELREEPLVPGVTYGLVTEVRDAIEALGEGRFPHIRHQFHELQKTTRDP
jgi:hypothetical protein